MHVFCFKCEIRNSNIILNRKQPITYLLEKKKKKKNETRETNN